LVSHIKVKTEVEDFL